AARSPALGRALPFSGSRRGYRSGLVWIPLPAQLDVLPIEERVPRSLVPFGRREPPDHQRQLLAAARSPPLRHHLRSGVVSRSRGDRWAGILHRYSHRAPVRLADRPVGGNSPRGHFEVRLKPDPTYRLKPDPSIALLRDQHQPPGMLRNGSEFPPEQD